ncbi:LysE family translocator [Lacibacterium aquatile]|uniref:LysE family translocator n=1 Tax=Lacibacterium aquatile TaxID=1168082 RepID=A0ABW5DW97_9PROT
MEVLPVLFSILAALLIGAMSPGPSFVMVSRLAISTSRRDGLAAALGMGAGGAAFGALALLGLATLLAQIDWLYMGFKIAGGLYLLYLGIRIWRGADVPLTVATGDTGASNPGRAFAAALLTQLSNPKTAVYYGSVFVALLPAQTPLWMMLVLPPLIFCLETGWYAVVALGFSADKPRALYLRTKGWVDRAAGAVMGALGIRLLIGATDR